MKESDCGCSNLNQREVRKRKILGYASLVTAFAMVALNKVQQTPHWVLWMPSIPFFFGYLGLFQAKTRTCVALAFTDKEVSNGTLGPVESRDKGWRLKKRAMKMIAGAGVLAFLSTAICSTL